MCVSYSLNSKFYHVKPKANLTAFRNIPIQSFMFEVHYYNGPFREIHQFHKVADTQIWPRRRRSQQYHEIVNCIDIPWREVVKVDILQAYPLRHQLFSLRHFQTASIYQQVVH